MTFHKELPMRASRASGFSLIEIMVVVAIVGILASIAFPSYTNYVRKARRTSAGACLTALAQRLERNYTVQMAYDNPVPNIPGMANTVCDDKAVEFYGFNSPVMAAKSFTLSAAPKPTQSGDECGTLNLNQAGIKGSSAGAGCW